MFLSTHTYESTKTFDKKIHVSCSLFWAMKVFIVSGIL